VEDPWDGPQFEAAGETQALTPAALQLQETRKRQRQGVDGSGGEDRSPKRTHAVGVPTPDLSLPMASGSSNEPRDHPQNLQSEDTAWRAASPPTTGRPVVFIARTYPPSGGLPGPAVPSKLASRSDHQYQSRSPRAKEHLFVPPRDISSIPVYFWQYEEGGRQRVLGYFWLPECARPKLQFIGEAVPKTRTVYRYWSPLSAGEPWLGVYSHQKECFDRLGKHLGELLGPSACLKKPVIKLKELPDGWEKPKEEEFKLLPAPFWSSRFPNNLVSWHTGAGNKAGPRRRARKSAQREERGSPGREDDLHQRTDTPRASAFGPALEGHQLNAATPGGRTLQSNDGSEAHRCSQCGSTRTCRSIWKTKGASAFLCYNCFEKSRKVAPQNAQQWKATGQQPSAGEPPACPPAPAPLRPQPGRSPDSSSATAEAAGAQKTPNAPTSAHNSSQSCDQAEAHNSSQSLANQISPQKDDAPASSQQGLRPCKLGEGKIICIECKEEHVVPWYIARRFVIGQGGKDHWPEISTGNSTVTARHWSCYAVSCPNPQCTAPISFRSTALTQKAWREFIHQHGWSGWSTRTIFPEALSRAERDSPGAQHALYVCATYYNAPGRSERYTVVIPPTIMKYSEISKTAQWTALLESKFPLAEPDSASISAAPPMETAVGTLPQASGNLGNGIQGCIAASPTEGRATAMAPPHEHTTACEASVAAGSRRRSQRKNDGETLTNARAPVARADSACGLANLHLSQDGPSVAHNAVVCPQHAGPGEQLPNADMGNASPGEQHVLRRLQGLSLLETLMEIAADQLTPDALKTWLSQCSVLRGREIYNWLITVAKKVHCAKELMARVMKFVRSISKLITASLQLEGSILSKLLVVNEAVYTLIEHGNPDDPEDYCCENVREALDDICP